MMSATGRRRIFSIKSPLSFARRAFLLSRFWHGRGYLKTNKDETIRGKKTETGAAGWRMLKGSGDTVRGVNENSGGEWKLLLVYWEEDTIFPVISPLLG